ncbi:MAG: M48 family metalloprotease [Planctomycetota bacterium]
MTTAFVNNVKTAVLLAVLLGLFIGVAGMINQAFLLPALLIGGVMNVFAYFFSDTIAIKAMRGRAVDAENGGDLYRMVDDLRRRADLPMPKVYICPQDAPNAFATGRDPEHSAVTVTEGALRLLDYHELEGVMAHELAHVKNRDTLTSTIAATVAGVLAFIAQWGLLFGAAGQRSNPFVAFIGIILAAVGAAVVRAMISRSREYAADADGAAIAGNPMGLVSALQKLDSVSRRIPMQQPNPAQNNLFIVEPLMGSKGLTNLFATHPPVQKRVAKLMAA